MPVRAKDHGDWIIKCINHSQLHRRDKLGKIGNVPPRLFY